MNTYIGYSNDDNIRYQATSGGIGTSIIKYLFDSSQIQTSITFAFNSQTLVYSPQFIYSFEDYKPTGSIYQEVDLIDFLRNNVDKIQGTFACFCLPCQAKAIRNIINKSGHQCYLLGLTCSSQQTIDATYYLLNRLKINKDDVTHLQYRGNGWPSGIQIHTVDGKCFNVPNAPSLWSQIFHSRLFIRKKCFYCQNTLNTNSDIALADPWLPTYMNDEKIGQTIATSMSDFGEKIIQEAKEKKYITINEFSEQELLESQKMTIARKKANLKNRKQIEVLIKFFQSGIYRKIIFIPFFWPFHVHLKQLIERFNK